MDFDSPEAEQDFPVLYAESKTGDEESRKILSVKKKKEKDKGYKAFEEDGSGASCEDVNRISSSRRFKFGKSSSKASSSKPTKVKLFGVDLKEVLQRNPSADSRSPLVPKFLTDLLNYLEKEHKPGVNFYKGTSHYKSKIHQARHALNYGQKLSLQEPQIVAGLVKLFLREQPSHILGPVMEYKLEETKPSEKKTQKILNLYQKEVSDVNKAVFERLVLHMEIIGIDLTPLLRVSQKALVGLKPVMSKLSIEDELKVEEARLARMHMVVAKAKDSKDKSKAKDNNQEKLWEAQRNVTQLKRKLKQISSTNTVEIKEVEMNFEERREENEPTDNHKKDETDNKQVSLKSRHPQQDLEKNPDTSLHGTPTENVDNKEELPAEKAIVDVIHEEKERVSKLMEPEEQVKVDNDDTKIQTDEVQSLEAPLGNQTKISPAPEPKHHEILQPVPAPVIETKLKDETSTQEDNIARTFRDEAFEPEVNTFVDGKNATTTKLEALSGKPLDAGELQRVQQEWQHVIIEQVELVRVKDDFRRRIRDEHKQIKMIQMVRNHKSRLASMKPGCQNPLEKMSTEKLQEVLLRLIESNDKLTKDTQALADKVFEETMSLVQLRASQKQPFVGFDRPSDDYI